MFSFRGRKRRRRKRAMPMTMTMTMTMTLTVMMTMTMTMSLTEMKALVEVTLLSIVVNRNNHAIFMLTVAVNPPENSCLVGFFTQNHAITLGFAS
jgi:hypothetical protein